MKKPSMLLAAIGLTALAGCGGGGLSDAEIEQAFRATAPFAARTSPAFHDFKVRRCEPVASDKVFLCEFAYMQMGRTEIAKAKFNRSNEGWARVDLESIAAYNDSTKAK